MARVKSQKLSAAEQGVADRVGMIRRLLRQPPDKPLSQPGLHARLVDRYGATAPSLTTVKRWEQKGRISGPDAEQLADLVGCTVDWIRRGRGRAPAFLRRQPLVVRERPIAGIVRSGTAAERTSSSAPAEPLSADDIADAVASVLEPLVKRLDQKGGSFLVGRWLLAVATEANRQGLDDVQDILRLATHYLSAAPGDVNAQLSPPDDPEGHPPE